ncbi:MAG: DNA translocase FtsK [Bacilli bacterium]|jgi:S-DNA-T family DNA segregation ATPase FtsK/SpoIIIE|nr:DNA translocase FtsK [Bacilli bacterium]MDY0064573.1 DNA translocase FtsK [Bacilli bacterium]
MADKKFIIPQIEDKEPEIIEDEEQKQPNYKVEPFISSIFGTKVKDEITFSGAQYGNKGRQYDAFREKEQRINKEDYKDYLISRPEEMATPFYQQQPKPLPKEEAVPEELGPKRFEAIKKPYEENEEEPKSLYDDIELELEETEEKEPLEEYTVKKTPSHSSKSIKYVAPPLQLLKRGKPVRQNDLTAVQFQREKIDETLREFDIAGHVVHFTKGPAVTQFEVQLDPGIRVQKVKNISSNLMAALRAKNLRIQAPIPGKSTVGIEAPNEVTDLVLFGELLSQSDFLNDNKPMNVVLGLDLGGNPVYLDLSKMPHCLIGGTTGSGKSVCINSIITSILYKAHPDDVKLILIDPKIIEFAHYEDIPHLATPVITEPKVATAALKWAVEEMQNRYQLFRTMKVREYDEYFKLAASNKQVQHIPYIVIVIDELADLMMVSGNDVEDYIQRLTQKGRASGIHLIVATQRPSVDVIKGTIKTNIPTRIAFMVKTQIDSTIILDHSGAEKLLGHGDMLYNDSVSEQRLQGAFISAEEIKKVTKFIREQTDAQFLFTTEELEEKLAQETYNDGINDEMFSEVARFVVENNSASINRIQQAFKIGFNRAQAIVQGLEDLGIVSENMGSRARNVEVSLEQLESILEDL